MSRIKNMPRLGWFIVGVVLTILLMPSVAVAAGLKLTGIEGTNGTSTTLNEANVASSGQLSTSVAPPSKLFTAFATNGPDTPISTIVAPSGKDDIVTSIVVTDQTSEDNAFVYVDPSPDCNSFGYSIVFTDDDATQTVHSASFPTGIPVPNGDSLCLNEGNVSDSAVAQVSGYSVPAGTVSGSLATTSSNLNPLSKG
jgi:hypothetical protein